MVMLYTGQSGEASLHDEGMKHMGQPMQRP